MRVKSLAAAILFSAALVSCSTTGVATTATLPTSPSAEKPTSSASTSYVQPTPDPSISDPTPSESETSDSTGSGGLIVHTVAGGSTHTVWTGVEPSTGEGIAHKFRTDTPNAQLGSDNYYEIPGYLGGRIYSPAFDAIVYRKRGIGAEPASVGWVTDSGTTVDVSGLVVSSDSFSEAPVVANPQFDAAGNFYFKVDNDVYKTAYSGSDDPATPVKVAKRSKVLVVWADGKVDQRAYNGPGKSALFYTGPAGKKSGIWFFIHPVVYMGFWKGGWAGTCSEARQICTMRLDRAADQPVLGSYPAQIGAITKRSSLRIASGAVDPSGTRIAFITDPVNIGGNDRQLFMVDSDGAVQKITDMTAATGGDIRILCWLPD